MTAWDPKVAADEAARLMRTRAATRGGVVPTITGPALEGLEDALTSAYRRGCSDRGWVFVAGPEAVLDVTIELDRDALDALG